MNFRNRLPSDIDSVLLKQAYRLDISLKRKEDGKVAFAYELTGEVGDFYEDPEGIPGGVEADLGLVRRLLEGFKQGGAE